MEVLNLNLLVIKSKYMLMEILCIDIIINTLLVTEKIQNSKYNNGTNV